jgi:ankyrin repeat protein
MVVGMTALHVAALKGDLETVRRLVNAGMNKNAKNHEGMTPMMYAAHKGHSNVIRYLLNKGANARIGISPNHPMTAIHFAAEEGHVNAVRHLIKHSNLRHTDGNGRSVLTIAAGLNDPRMMRMLIKAGARPNNGTLEYLFNNRNKRNRLAAELIRWSRAKRAIPRTLRTAAASRRTHAMRGQLGSVRVRTGSTTVNGIPVHIRNMIAAYMRRA